ncbi:MAG: heavy metal translocating P-type ATPase metal-binding domain-containing protein [Raineya sp.]|jgi:Cu+-exporting ATPase|nr:heavy metal translocating P-type ATPase metal-binding domain-containing protein [Raineya sp.]
MASNHTHIEEKTTCYHCGDTCKEVISYDEKRFCCNGCQNVYAILQENNLCEYYNLNDLAGNTVKNTIQAEKFAYLNLPEIKSKIIDFSDGKIGKVTFYLPQIHCSSCIWLLENLHKINAGVRQSRVDFLKKKVAITYSEEQTDLQTLAALLSQIGYEPHITLNDTEEKDQEYKHLSKAQRKVIAKIAVAGFSFGNIMLISFPEYFGFDSHSEGSFKHFFQYVNFALVLPSFFFGGWDYLTSAYRNLKKGVLNIDFPLALGLIVLFIRSLFEIITGVGAGYTDTLAGLIFFLLLGKWFQQKTYDVLRYNRDFKSYFPVAVAVKNTENQEAQKPVNELKVGDRIIIRNQELIPADAILLKGEANIDYSFVTGEAMPTEKVLGEMIYAGGRQMGATLELEVMKPVSQSYLTELWNKDDFQKKHYTQETTLQLQSFLSKYFTYGLLIVAFSALGFWFIQNDLPRAINAFTAVLIIACPCALALSSPFALGTAMRILGKWKLYLKNVSVIENLAKVQTIIFDKTGTITERESSQVEFVAQNERLNSEEVQMIANLVRNSTHPLSQHIYHFLSQQAKIQEIPLESFKEISGKGLEAKIFNKIIKIGSSQYVGIPKNNNDYTTKVFVQIENTAKGYFLFHNTYREGLENLTSSLINQGYDLHLLSGDNKGEAAYLERYFLRPEKLHFNQSPQDKWSFVNTLQQNNQSALMLGDGLNDAGALQKADVGIAVTDNIAYFTPASDAILDAKSISYLGGFMAFAKKSIQVIKWSFVISLIYNLIGLFFAVQGTLSPLIAAILMPISSITVVAFTTLSVSNYEKVIKNAFNKK